MLIFSSINYHFNYVINADYTSIRVKQVNSKGVNIVKILH